MSQELQNALQSFIRETVETQIKDSLNKINLNESVAEFVKQSVQDKINNLEFPHGSINNSAINWETFKLNAGMITGDFGNLTAQTVSTPELNTNDAGVYVTQSLHSPDIVGENITTTSINAEKITTNTIDAQEINAHSIVGLHDQIKRFMGGDSLSKTVINSNLKTVGTLQDLVVAGETLLGDTLYSSNTKRVGINTDEPQSTLTLWDEETNLNIGKSKQHTIGIRSKSDIEIGSGTKNNIVLTQTGDTTISNPILDKTRFTTVKETPGFHGEKGDLAWNSDPKVGQPVGWVCLGETVWAKFGVAE